MEKTPREAYLERIRPLLRQAISLKAALHSLAANGLYAHDPEIRCPINAIESAIADTALLVIHLEWAVGDRHIDGAGNIHGPEGTYPGEARPSTERLEQIDADS